MSVQNLAYGDRVEIVGGKYRPKRNEKPLFAKVVTLSGKSMVTVAIEIEGKPITTIRLTSVALVTTATANSDHSKSVTETPTSVISHARSCLNCTNCAESERLKSEIKVLTKALSDLCSSIVQSDESIGLGRSKPTNTTKLILTMTMAEIA
jgi:hypothetical protein